MSRAFEELDYRPTLMGALSLRRRRIPSLDIDVLEVLLGDEHLMSSLFTEGEIALTTIGLAAAPDRPLEVMVGGLGLGYTAAAALKDPRLKSLTVIDAMEGVIDWHRAGLVPLGPVLCGDSRCVLELGDFYAAVGPGAKRRFDAILLDIDHSPDALLHSDHGRFYSPEGMGALAACLTPGGVFAMWSDAAPDDRFTATLSTAFGSVEATVVSFDNPLSGGQSTCTIYVARL